MSAQLCQSVRLDLSFGQYCYFQVTTLTSTLFCVLFFLEFDSERRIIISMKERFLCHFRPLNPFGKILQEFQDFPVAERTRESIKFCQIYFIFCFKLDEILDNIKRWRKILQKQKFPDFNVSF